MNINKKRKSFLLLGLFCFLLSYLYSSFDVPITYQGTVTTPGGGAPANDNYAMRFSLWNLEVGGTDIDNLKWSESFVGDNKV